MRSVRGRTALAFLLAASCVGAAVGDRPAAAASSFAAEVARLSEPGGAFDTDNLISNEMWYLHVVPTLGARGVSGGAYIGVGPDQNFSYIARIRPAVAYIIDIRRDNLLLHLLFKALFAEAPTRIEFLSALTGRAPPPMPQQWDQAPLSSLIAHIDEASAAPAVLRQLRGRVNAAIAAFGIPLSKDDAATIARFHQTFADWGLALQFQTHGRLPMPHYPTFRQLLTATGTDGRQWNYLAAEDDYQFLRTLQARGGIVPVVGNIAGSHAMAGIADAIAAAQLRVSALYVSNIESYLDSAGRARFNRNVARLPQDGRSVIIRSVFSGGSSRSMVHPMDPR